MSDRAVSEVVGFVLVFALVVSTVGVVYVVGFDGLENSRSAEQVNNAGRAFDVLADNMEDMYADGAPSRATEIKLADASLSTGTTPTKMAVEIHNDPTFQDGAGNPIVYSVPVSPIRYSSPDQSTQFVYEGGAVVRQQRNGAVLMQDPPFVFSQSQTVLQFVSLKPTSGSQSVAGSATVLVRGELTGRNVLVQAVSNPDVQLTITTETARADRWETYIEGELDGISNYNDGDPATDPCEVTDIGGGRSEVTCVFKPDELYVTVAGIDVTLL